MDRKKFIRNVIGTLAAVTIGKHLPSPVPGEKLVATYHGRPDLPGTGKKLFKLLVKDGWFTPGDIMLKDTASMFTTDASQYYIDRRDGKLIAFDINTNEPKIELIETGPMELKTHTWNGNSITFRENPWFDKVYDGDYAYTKLGNALPELPEPQLEPKFRMSFIDSEAITNAI